MNDRFEERNLRRCDTPGCTNKHRAKGLCAACYAKANRKEWAAARAAETRPCAFDGCDQPFYCKGLCVAHYRQQARGYELVPIGSPRQERTPRAEHKPRPTTPKKRPVSKFPKGWERTSTPTPERTNGLGAGFLPEIPPVAETAPEIVEKAARTLLLMGANDLAEMLGVAA